MSKEANNHVESLYITESKFPEVFRALNELADKSCSTPSTRPSIRKLAADLLHEICTAKLTQIEQESQAKSCLV